MPPTPPAPLPVPDIVRDIVVRGRGALASVADRRAWQFGELWSFSLGEHEKLEAVSERIKQYLNFANPKRPLCIAVFGPPGSGKSTGVREILKRLRTAGGSPPDLTELNLTQFGATQEVAKAVAAVARKPAGPGSGQVPIIFFDEFDAALNGSPLGWLSWFLAPMQDGKFVLDGEVIELAKAVYFFAGGTAATMEEFGRHDRDGFRLAKGPDFVSRLHSYIDVRGPNDRTELELRRGMALWFALDASVKRIGRTLELDDAFIGELVRAGRYRHGQRSVEAVITLMAERAAAGAKLGRAALPPDFLLDMQVDRGPLDPETIGGLIGLSGGGFPSGKERTDRDDMWVKLADELWALGATIAYGGNWDPDGLTRALMNVVLPYRLRRDARDEPRIEVHAMEPPPTSDPRVTPVLVAPPALRGASKAIRQAALLFRMRWQSGLRCRARVLLSGRTDGFSGRMPGIIEEAMIAIALRQPIYVIGGFGGAAKLLGELLGLSTWTRPATAFKPAPGLKLDGVARFFRPPGYETLPLTTDEALSYIAGNAIGSPAWTWNGLTVEENRSLFARNAAEAGNRRKTIDLIRQGLLRRFDG